MGQYPWSGIGPWSGKGAWDGTGPWTLTRSAGITYPLGDWFAVISTGTFPTPTPTASERSYFSASYGLRDSL